MQVVVYGGAIREKPVDEAEARAFIASYADGPATTVGSCVCACLETGEYHEHVEENSAHIAPLPQASVDALIEEGQVFQCAGGASWHTAHGVRACQPPGRRALDARGCVQAS